MDPTLVSNYHYTGLSQWILQRFLTLKTQKSYAELLKYYEEHKDIYSIGLFRNSANESWKWINDEKVELVGNDDIYIPVCRFHYLEN